MSESTAPAEPPSPVYVPHQDFKTGLPFGRFRLIVNPERAQKYVRHKLFVNGICLPVLGIGVASALVGYVAVGVVLVVIAVATKLMVKKYAPKILVHLAQQDAKIYDEAIEHEILEVRYAG
jgi:hypothetical protein